ncbi:hypothetical protein Q5Y75_05710 [Ruegeria sp. 2205SS24-7]|uniref:hypothetical protein n=1 Tax=Ruegeria discodermiae TaxID=3064389 RepID=UPI0027413422|nr:hypothetical protein [Ruegeria sp. 2205SS24-7]MDP5216707.1 hypothetical protein [Ruegeria sp. 2205SS24-7]
MNWYGLFAGLAIAVGFFAMIFGLVTFLNLITDTFGPTTGMVMAFVLAVVWFAVVGAKTIHK